MATPRKAQPRRPAATVTYNHSDPSHVLVDPRWLGKILGYTVLVAFFCAYLLMCALFRVGSWQWVLHPTHNASPGTGLPGELVHFAPDASGTPQITGEWIPAKAATGGTVLYLRPGDGQLNFADAPLLTQLHNDGLNVLAFDYRGYGRSAAKPHPTEERMQQDAEAAWAYATGLRGIPANQILLYGAGVGSTLATNLAATHPQAAALVLRNATADVLGTIRREKRARMFPVALLLKDRFDLHALQQVTTPKLLWDIGSQPNDPEQAARIAAYRVAADPKMTVTLPNPNPAEEAASLRRFLDDRAGLLPPSSLTTTPSSVPQTK
ncbi:alpha/beta hydrolase [Terriglobus sp.]|uniref:alpha/beta hydrolase n=1 Tax=Terriglobus sp. TaxID=1889013 RepID=UPI003AFF9B9F